ncbi:glycerol-3-phosphate 1-O-acyltransferase PlsY [Plastoroseomonas arctica]|uniref:Glycerol-3-phosphate acyltransferase n=1 Tax=Plastoroseomonas arctica TaxID=1509237 RepID=A0AAF1JUN3_9PROT|nr:glycerol-3-phosphate 1-O-acyltransferase PlsY [Plastoroseomonas arctica]MBR0653824.1 glycerol-3-phosphate 1-O-acyltransferase PlsY [Plastoroseomonas arctica]
MNPSLYFLAALVVGYLLGSIPFGFLLTRAAGLGDIRTIGSGNIGATNVLRTGNKKVAAATLFCDALKGAVAVWLFPADPLAAGTAVVLGHMFPVWLRFRGGKGVATGIGVYLAAMWPVGVFICATWLVGALLTRISSAGALLAFALAPITAWALVDAEHALLALLVGVLIFWRHEDNIRRLIAGTEPRIGKAARSP